MKGHKVVTVERGDGYAAHCETCGDITFGGFTTRTEARAALAHEEAPAGQGEGASTDQETEVISVSVPTPTPTAEAAPGLENTPKLTTRERWGLQDQCAGLDESALLDWAVRAMGILDAALAAELTNPAHMSRAADLIRQWREKDVLRETDSVEHEAVRLAAQEVTANLPELPALPPPPAWATGWGFNVTGSGRGFDMSFSPRGIEHQHKTFAAYVDTLITLDRGDGDEFELVCGPVGVTFDSSDDDQIAISAADAMAISAALAAAAADMAAIEAAVVND